MNSRTHVVFKRVSGFDKLKCRETFSLCYGLLSLDQVPMSSGFHKLPPPIFPNLFLSPVTFTILISVVSQPGSLLTAPLARLNSRITAVGRLPVEDEPIAYGR